MMMDISVKVPQELVLEAAEELNSFKCLRKSVKFKLFEEVWKVDFVCGKYGNGYGAGFRCDDDCDLRITDLDKCRKVETEYGHDYLVQDDFYKEKQ